MTSTQTAPTRQYAQPIVRLSVYRSSLGDSSNGGLSSRHDTVELYAHDVYEFDIDPAKLDSAVKIVYRSHLGVVHVEPVAYPEADAIGWMAGGTVVGTSDSRLSKAVQDAGLPGRFYGAMSLHDRQESQSLYRALSR